MSWDIFVQDLPAKVDSISDIPDNFVPGPLGKRAAIISKILEVAPSADFSDPRWGVIEGNDFSIEINLGYKEIVQGFAFHVRGSEKAVQVMINILNHLEFRALDASSGEILDLKRARDSFQQWKVYRDFVISSRLI